MENIYKYKEQGDGRDSWICEEFDEKGELLNKYMIYENPYEEKKVNLSNIDIDTLPEDQLMKLINKIKSKL